jgi:uncharacterized protein DUF5681
MSRSRTPKGPGSPGKDDGNDHEAETPKGPVPPSKDAGKDYEVGYGRPPVATRFRPGGIGNPRGRPKKRKTVGQRIDEALMTRVTVEEKGRPKSMTAEDVIIRNLVNAAARRDMRAIHLLFALRDRYQNSVETALDPADLAPEDRKIIEEYFASLRASGIEPAPKDRANEDAPDDKTAPPGEATGTPGGAGGEAS